MISFTGVILLRVLRISVILSLLSITEATDTNGLTFKYQDKANTILQLSCDGRGVALKGSNLSIAIFNVTSMKTLAQMIVGECPWAGDSGETVAVYTLVCLLHDPDPLPVLKMIVTDVGPSPAPKFGCNITYMNTTNSIQVVTWTISAYRSNPTLVTEQRTAESRLQPLDRPNLQADSRVSVYGMGFAILSLALALAAALCYIGMQKLKSRSSSGDTAGAGRSGRAGDNTADLEEAIGDAGSGPDGGCERSLINPNSAFRRPSYQDYSEPMSPTPSTVSDYAGMDFLQIQLSDRLVTAPHLKLPRKNFTKKSINSKRIRIDKIGEYYNNTTMGNNMYIKTADILNYDKCNEARNGCLKCPFDGRVVVLEYTTTEILDCSDDDVLSYLSSYA